ncbi:MAG: rhodanese-like domain-containing protein [Clostridia bacterium]|nr:rhodanese-like domain-containing protein [Clostridia bacterium]
MLFGNIMKGLAEYESTPGALLADVREAEEFAAGHIPGAVNFPLSVLSNTALPQDRPLFLYCLRGARSRRAAGILKRMGYTRVKSIGGIAGYKGSLER